LKIALLGHGTVGSGVYELIMKNRSHFKEVYGKEMDIERILVNRLENYKHLPYNELFSNQFDDFKDLSVDVAIETIGGIEPAFDYVSHFLAKGVPVITSNKDLIAERGNLLTALAKANNTSIRYEASVGGGIPILKPLGENLAGDRIIEIAGIVNGTTNYILTKMNNDALNYNTALAMAQNLGFAEADPTSDVEGLDSVRKIAILTKIGLNIDVDWKSIPVEGITEIDSNDIAFFNQEQLNVKLIGITKLTKDGIYCSVRPVLVDNTSKFASIHNEYNAVRVQGESVGELMFTGKGAGQLATATSVLGDLVDLILNTKIKINKKLENKTLVRFFPDQADWIVKLTGVSSNDIFDEHVSVSEDTHFMKFAEINEEALIKKLKTLSSQLGCDHKYYLIYE
jgi:homoserine dehydrogenase